MAAVSGKDLHVAPVVDSLDEALQGPRLFGHVQGPVRMEPDVCEAKKEPVKQNENVQNVMLF